MAGEGTAGAWQESMLRVDSEMAALVTGFDWSASELGPIEQWPESLRTSVAICLTSRFPILLWWGPELVMIYNDAYRPILGASKHPSALGSPGRAVWPEIWHVIGPMLHGVLSGKGATWSDDQLLLLDRNGFLEECYFTFSYSPIVESTGRVGGVFCAVTETTDRIVGSRRLTTLEVMASGLVDATDAAAVCETAEVVLTANNLDVRFAEIYPVDEQMIRPGRDAGAAEEWPLAKVVRTGVAQLVELENGPGARQAYVIPVVEPGRTAASAVLVVGLNEQRPFDGGYRSFLDLSAGHIGTGLAGARAFAAERQRAQGLAELDAAKTTFFSNMSHELRTPLTLIAGPVQDALADSGDPLPQRQRERLQVVVRNTNRLRRLINAMLDFARIEGGRLVPEPVAVDLAQVTADLAANFEPAVSRAGLRFTAHTPRLPKPTYVDRDMWDQIVLNLLSNAVKYTLDGEITLELHDAGPHAELVVRDTGVGIPAPEIPRLFERFHRVRGAGGRSHEGSGIGLALVAELLRLLGGSISVESSLGTGSTFTVRLPYGQAASTSRWEDRDARAAVGPYVEESLSWTPDDREPEPDSFDGRPRLLIAEDNADMRRYLAEVVGSEYRVELAVDGEDALKRALATPPDVLLADVMMPRLDGFGLVAAVRSDPRLAGIPVVLLSARAGEEATADGFAAGADDYLVKPFSAADLRTRLRSNLARAAARTRDAAWRAAMLNSLSEGVCVADETGVVIEVNDAFERVTGWGMRTAPYPPPYPWWPTDQQDLEGRQLLDRAMVQALDVGAGEHEVPFRHREGHTVWVAVTVAEVGTGGGERMLVGTVRDITREHGLRELRKEAVMLAAALTSETDLQDLYGAAVHGFGQLFGGEAMILVGDPTAGAITADGHQDITALPDEVRVHLVADGVAGPAVGGSPGILISATGSEHRVWVAFPAPRLVTADEHLVAAMLGEVLATGLDRATLEVHRRHSELNLRNAIESHRFIGQAAGILMERHRLSAAAAFSRLRDVSQRHNVKLRLLAEHVIETGLDPAEFSHRS